MGKVTIKQKKRGRPSKKYLAIKEMVEILLNSPEVDNRMRQFAVNMLIYGDAGHLKDATLYNCDWGESIVEHIQKNNK